MVVELFLSVVAGAATAAAATRINSMRTRHLPTLGANSRLKSEIRTLDAQKRILEKSIARLYTDGMGLSAVQRDTLLTRYQEQLASIGVHTQKLIEASKHPDLGSLGDGLVTLMDQKLSGIEEKFGQLYAKIDAEQPREQKPKMVSKPETHIPTTRPTTTIDVPSASRRIELATLTKVPSRSSIPLQPLVATTGYGASSNVIESQPDIAPPLTPRVEKPTIQDFKVTPSVLKPESEPITTQPVIEPASDLTGQPSVLKHTPEPVFIPPTPEPPIITPPDIDSEIDDTDADSISQIKKDIQAALKKIDQAEVE